MEQKEFKTKLIELLKSDSLILTPVNVGMKLGMDADVAVTKLDELCSDGTLELVSGSGSNAVYRPKDGATYETTPGVESVKKPKSTQAINHAIFCLFFPGLASLFYGRYLLGLTVLAIAGAGGYMIYALDDFSKLFSILLFILAWVVSAIGAYMNFASDPWTKK